MLQKRILLRRQLDNQRGTILLMVLVSITLLGLMAGIAGSSWQTIMQRANEVDLLWKGNQIRRAIGKYYNTFHAQSAAPKAFPSELDFLIRDPRFLETRRYLRRLYPDPMTGEDWVIIKDPAGRVMGVRSSSDKMPFKQDGFDEVNKDFADQEKYSGWQFVYELGSETEDRQLKKKEHKKNFKDMIKESFRSPNRT